MPRYFTTCDNTSCSEHDKKKRVEFKEENKIIYFTVMHCALCDFILQPQLDVVEGCTCRNSDPDVYLHADWCPLSVNFVGGE